MTGKFRGHAEARIDNQGRLKMPSHFKKALESTYGRALFVTALTDDYLHIYPMPVWEELENRVHGLGMMHPARHRFLTRVNRYGQEVDMDKQGRLVLKPSQKELVGISDQVVLVGCLDHLQLWAANDIDNGKGSLPLTADDFSMLGI